MVHPFSHYQQSADLIRSRMGDFTPDIALVLGSGLGFLGDMVEQPVAIPYGDIPHFPRSTAPGHAGRLVLGTLAGKRVAVMQGRMHHYEGWSYEEVSYPVRVLKLIGCETLILTNAAGCVNTAWAPGDIMVISDQIKIFMESPLRGENLAEFGPRFPDMSKMYSPALRALAHESARELGLELREGVYCSFPGPQFETPAEVRLARTLGGDAVGMSTAPEAIVAVHAGMEVLGFSLMTNMGAGILDQPLSGEEVNATAEACREQFSHLVLRCLEKL